MQFFLCLLHCSSRESVFFLKNLSVRKALEKENNLQHQLTKLKIENIYLGLILTTIFVLFYYIFGKISSLEGKSAINEVSPISHREMNFVVQGSIIKKNDMAFLLFFHMYHNLLNFFKFIFPAPIPSPP